MSSHSRQTEIRWFSNYKSLELSVAIATKADNKHKSLLPNPINGTNKIGSYVIIPAFFYLLFASFPQLNQSNYHSETEDFPFIKSMESLTAIATKTELNRVALPGNKKKKFTIKQIIPIKFGANWSHGFRAGSLKELTVSI